MRIKATNLSPVDVVIDVNGNGDTKDKVILHPRATEILTISPSAYSIIKGTAGLVLQVQKELGNG